jgi:hypothetical protein
VPGRRSGTLQPTTITGDHAVVNPYLFYLAMIMLNMDLPGLRTWVVFYLISFVVLLWAAFLSSQGVMLWVSLLLVILIIGINFVTVLNQIKAHAARRAFLRDLTSGLERGEKDEGEEKH